MNCLRRWPCGDKVRDFTGERALLGGEQEGKGTQEGLPGRMAPRLRFMVMGLVSKVSSASPSDSGLPGGECLVQPGWTPERRIWGGGLTCCAPLTFPELFQLLVGSLAPGLYQDLLVKQLMQMVTMVSVLPLLKKEVRTVKQARVPPRTQKKTVLLCAPVGQLSPACGEEGVPRDQRWRSRASSQPRPRTIGSEWELRP